MADFTYTAKRKIKTGHVLDDPYIISIDVQSGDIQPAPVQQVNISLSGRQVTTVSRLDEKTSLVTDFFNAGTTPDFDDLQEFIYSVIHGESFTYDDGSGARTVVLDGTPSLSRSGVYFSWSLALRFIT